MPLFDRTVASPVLGACACARIDSEGALGGGKSQQHVSERYNHTIAPKIVVVVVITFDVPLGVIFGDSVGRAPHAEIRCLKCIAHGELSCLKPSSAWAHGWLAWMGVPVCLFFRQDQRRELQKGLVAHSNVQLFWLTRRILRTRSKSVTIALDRVPSRSTTRDVISYARRLCGAVVWDGHGAFRRTRGRRLSRCSRAVPPHDDCDDACDEAS